MRIKMNSMKAQTAETIAPMKVSVRTSWMMPRVV